MTRRTRNLEPLPGVVGQFRAVVKDSLVPARAPPVLETFLMRDTMSM